VRLHPDSPKLRQNRLPHHLFEEGAGDDATGVAFMIEATATLNRLMRDDLAWIFPRHLAVDAELICAQSPCIRIPSVILS
jgi:hypothetical protein